jgi:hypothetical protein
MLLSCAENVSEVHAVLDIILIALTLLLFAAFDRYTVALERL